MFKSSLWGREDIFYSTEKGSVIQEVLESNSSGTLKIPGKENYNFWRKNFLPALKY